MNFDPELDYMVIVLFRLLLLSYYLFSFCVAVLPLK